MFGEWRIGEGGVLLISFAKNEEVGILGFGFGKFKGLNTDSFLFFC